MLPILLPQRGVFSLTLTDPAVAAAEAVATIGRFLQNIITADVAPLLKGQAIYSALLTANGKYIADFLAVARGGVVLVETDRALADNLIANLQKYILRQPLTISPLLPFATTGVAVTFDPPLREKPLAEGFFITDPRPATTPCYRLYGKVAGAETDQTPYKQWRIDNCLPEGSDDFVAGESLIVEYHLQDKGGLSLQKGCFVGQEVTARIYYKQALTHKLKKSLVTETIPATVEAAKGAGTTPPPEQGGDRWLSSVKVGDLIHRLVLKKNS